MNAPVPLASTLQVEDWGSTTYAEGLRRQEALLTQRLAGTAPDTLVFTEHAPVFTIGLRAGAAQHLCWSESELAAQGVEVAYTNRGGDITYHGPGQLVGYPIVSLQTRRDLHAYLRFLEDVLIETVGCYGLNVGRREGKTGIWTGSRKLAAIGVAVRRWVTYHGFALNVNTRLEHFNGIVPCGIQASDGTVSSLERELGHALPLTHVRDTLAQVFRERWPQFLAAGAGLDKI